MLFGLIMILLIISNNILYFFFSEDISFVDKTKTTITNLNERKNKQKHNPITINECSKCLCNQFVDLIKSNKYCRNGLRLLKSLCVAVSINSYLIY